MLWGTLLITGYLAVATLPLVITDARTHRLPNGWVMPGMGVALVAVGLNSLQQQACAWIPLACGLSYGALCLLLHLIGGMGMGDVKLALALGLAAGMFGWQVGLTAVIVAFFTGGVFSLVLLTVGRVCKRKAPKHIAFGPFMLLGFWMSSAATGLPVLLGQPFQLFA